MNETTEDSQFIIAIMLVWLVVAILYQTVAVLDMPPAKRIWGASAAMFFVLAWAVRKAETDDAEE